MPVVLIHMLPGRERRAKELLMQGVTDAVTAALGVAPESVRVILNEVPEEHYAIAGLPIREFRSRRDRDAKKDHDAG
jgi:4-oxalocrotonate tautomerase